MNKWVFASLLTVLAALGLQSAVAGTISLNTTVSSTVQGDSLRVTVRVDNRGTESAYNGQAEIEVLGQRVATDKVSEFPVGKPVVLSAVAKLDATTPGTYPLVVTILYTDANQYPFSALASQVFPLRTTNSICDVVGRVGEVTLSTRGKTAVTLKNLGDKELATSTRLVVPRELTVDGAAVPLTLPGRAERTMKFTVANFSATGGSTYPAAAICEFDRDGRHYTMIASGVVKVVARREIMGLNYSLLGVILGALVLAFIVFQKFKK
jgi:hypothetical protein